MKAVVLKKYGHPDSAFELREVPKPVPGEGQVLIKTEASGINFADIMARKGLYQDAPPLPAVLGYEIIGKVEQSGKGVDLPEGQRVLAFTRFGGYSEYVCAGKDAVFPIPDEWSPAEAAALATQYVTAYYGAYELVNLFEDDLILIHAAAGGVGTALVQLAKLKKCRIIGTAGSEEKIKRLIAAGVDYPINYNHLDFEEEVRKISPQGVDVAFDSLGGKVYKKSLKCLATGGRLVSYGASERTSGKFKFFSGLQLVWDFGMIHPVVLLMKSRSILGLNMLRIADNKPQVLKRCLENVVKLAKEEKIKPISGGIFKVNQIGEAHLLIESRKSVGKVVVVWE
jgi:NADPH:quinone reductase-like Zn-dependent oxidoreductase